MIALEAPVVQQLALWIASENTGHDDLISHASGAPIPARVVVNPVDGRSDPAAGRYRSAGQDLIWEAGN